MYAGVIVYTYLNVTMYIYKGMGHKGFRSHRTLFFKYETTLYHYSAILSFYGTSKYATVIVKTQVVNLVACYERDL